MNSATVTNNNSYFMNVTGKGTNNMKGAGNSKGAENQDFTQVMNKASATETNSAGAVQKKLDNAFIEKAKQSAVRENLQGNAEIKDVNAAGGANEMIAEKAEELLGKVAEKLGVSKEDVIAAMEALGIQMADLLNTDNMAQLVVQISGETDMMSLVTNEELYGKLTDLLQTVETALTELQKDLSVTPELLTDLIEQFNTDMKQAVSEGTGKDVLADTAADAEEVTSTSDATAVNRTDGKTEVSTKVDVAVDMNTNKNADSNEVKQTVIVEKVEEPTDRSQKNQQSQVQVQDETTAIEKPAAGKEQAAPQEDSGKGDGAAENNQSFMQGIMDKTAAAATRALETAVPPGKADTESIMKQMMDYMKLHISANVTEMEIQLQPANLGSINLQVATKNGVITAQLTAETEAVRKVIESQVVQLRESLNEQGIKIEAVEVTIASHEFERNLDQGAQSGQSKETDQSKKAGRKRIVLNEMDDAAEADLEETDKIQVQMMKQNGNNVNLMA